jgi:Beta-propeller repeat
MDDVARRVATDASGNVYAAGFSTGGLDGNVNSGSYDAFIVKYDSGGVKQWTRQLGTIGLDQVFAMAVDASGNAYVAGHTDGTLVDNTSVGGSDAFIAKYDTHGAVQWMRQFGTTAADYVYAMAVDAGGNAYVAGTTEGVSNDVFIAQVDSSGAVLSIQTLGTAAFDAANAVAVDSSGDVYVAGQTSGTFAGNTAAGDYDGFVAKLSAGGSLQWVRQFGTTAYDYLAGLSLDASGSAYVVGNTNGTFVDNTSGGGGDAFIAKYDTAGVEQWTRQFGTSSQDAARGVGLDTNGNTYVVGYTNGAFAGNTHLGDYDAVITKYDTAGVAQWTRQFGTAAGDVSYGVAADANGNIFAAGYTSGAFDGNPNAGSADIFVVKYTSDGAKR